MKVLVTGGAGFIGSNIVKNLENDGAKVIVLDDFSHAGFKNLEGVKGEIICGDVLDEALFKKLPPLDAVIHEAAITDTTLPDDRKMVMVNFNGFKNVLSFCRRRKIKLVYASSAGVYGAGPSPMSESQQPRPLNTYAYSKYLCDRHALKLMNKSSSLIAGVRYFNVYGGGESHKGASASMIYQLYLQMKSGRRPRVFKCGEQKRDFIYVKDVARMTIEVLKLKKSAILNIGTGAAESFNEIIRVLNETLGKNLKAVYFDNPYASVYQNHTRADVAAGKKLRITARFSLEEGIKDYVKTTLAAG